MSVAHFTSPFVTIYETDRLIAEIGSPLESQNTPVLLDERNYKVRLRLLLGNTSEAIPSDSTQLKLQYSAKFDTCDTGFVGESYADVQGASSNFQWLDNTNDSAYIDNDPNDPTNVYTNVPIGYYQEAPIVNNANVSTNTNGLLDLGITDVTTSVGSYCFRVVENSDNY